MNIKQLSVVALVAMFTFSTTMVAFDAEAKRSSSSSRSSFSKSSFKTSSSWSSSSSKKSSNSWSSSSSKKSSNSWSSSTKKKSSSNSWVAGSNTKKATTGKQHVTKATSQTIRKQTKSSFSSSVAKTKKVATSKTAYKQQRQQFKPRTVATRTSASSTYSYNKRSPIVNKTVIINNRSTYHKRRGRYYSDWDSPTYVYNSYPSFGMWDSMALWFMLDSINDANQMQMYYHHMNTPGMQEWRTEADRMARDNAELRAKLDKLDREQQRLAATGISRNEAYVPDGIDPDLLLAAEVLEDTKPVIRMCTGSKDMNYYNVAKIMGRDMSAARIVPVETNGSADNLRKLETGQCDGAIVQRDAYLSHVTDFPGSKLDFTRVLSPYAEIPHLVCNYRSGVTKLSDLSSNHTVLVGKTGSGSSTTWDNLVKEESDFGAVKTENVGGALAKARIQSEPNTCVLSVSGLKTKFMRDLNQIGFTTDLQLVNWNDGDIYDAVDPTGAQLYESYTLPSTNYPNLQQTAWHTLVSDTDVVTVPADVILNNTWIEQNNKAFEYFVSEAASKVSTIRRYVGGQ